MYIGISDDGVTWKQIYPNSSLQKCGTIIPFYVYPGPVWDKLIALHKAHPNMPMKVIANPNSGPDKALNSDYLNYIRKMQAAGIAVLGYVATGYDSRSVAAVEADITNWLNWYGVNGMFLDEMANLDSAAFYYSALTQYVHSKKPGSTVVGNPGTTESANLAASVDIVVVYEGSSGNPTFIPSFPASRQAVMQKYSQTLNSLWITNAATGCRWIYQTGKGAIYDYDNLPSYFDSELALLDTL